MPRLNPPLDDFEAEELDFPVFEPPARRATNSAPSAPRRAAVTRPVKAAPARTRNRLEEPAPPAVDFEMEFDDDFEAPSVPRPAKRRATKSGPAPKAARPQTSRPRQAPRAGGSSGGLTPLHLEIGGVVLIALALFLGYNTLRPMPEQAALPEFAVRNLRFLFGLGALVIPFAMLWLGLLLFFKRQDANLKPFWRGAGLGFFILLTGVHLLVRRGDELEAQNLFSHGGVTGALLAMGFRRVIGEVGTWIVLVSGTCVALLLWTQTSLSDILTRWQRRSSRKLADARQDMKERLDERAATRRERKEERQAEWEARQQEQQWEEEAVEERPQRRVSRRTVEAAFNARSHEPETSPFVPLEEVLGTGAVAPDRVLRRPNTLIDTEFSDAAAPEVDPESTIEAPRFLEAKSPALDFPRIEILDAPPPPSVVDEGTASLAHSAVHGHAIDDELTPIEALEAQAAASATEEGEPAVQRPQWIDERPRRRFGDGPFMPVYFDDTVRALDPPVPPDLAGVEEDIQKGVQSVQETLAAFKIDARVTDVKRGPVITRYEVQPAPGVRVASIANLDRDLARSLSALAVRIEAPVPGKNVVGIEVPNKRVHLVRMRDVLEQPDFLSHQSKLAFVLGKDIAGQPKWADLAKMPHMLIAGSTNSGKSVCLNSIIASILVRSGPEEVRFSLIDPKRVELTLYRGIPHLMHDVVVEPKQAVTALRRAIEEMDRRYKLFATRGVRNIASFNQKLQPNEKPMPYIVIVIDELADLMMTAAAEFEKLICRLAQLARATGIHLIVATQRPSVNVITGVIKANIPARVAFAVASQVDSRTILDSVGAERLIGSGDMLFDANNGGKSTRIQGAFLSEEEVNRVVNVVKDAYLHEDSVPQGLTMFDLWSEDSDDDFADDKPSPDEKRDDLYDSIKEFVMRHQEMSASMIQRKFEIGYPRAGRIVDQLERDGVLGPADGPKPRKVLGPGRG